MLLLGAVVGLLHDVILTFGLIVLFKLEFSLNMVAAVLTVIGYSMNDTVVVFDRLRENLRKYKTKKDNETVLMVAKKHRLNCNEVLELNRRRQRHLEGWEATDPQGPITAGRKLKRCTWLLLPPLVCPLRTELSALKVSELKRRCRHLDPERVPEVELDAADDAANPKEALIELCLAKAQPQRPVPMRLKVTKLEGWRKEKGAGEGWVTSDCSFIIELPNRLGNQI